MIMRACGRRPESSQGGSVSFRPDDNRGRPSLQSAAWADMPGETEDLRLTMDTRGFVCRSLARSFDPIREHYLGPVKLIIESITLGQINHLQLETPNQKQTKQILGREEAQELGREAVLEREPDQDLVPE